MGYLPRTGAFAIAALSAALCANAAPAPANPAIDQITNRLAAKAPDLDAAATAIRALFAKDPKAAAQGIFNDHWLDPFIAADRDHEVIEFSQEAVVALPNVYYGVAYTLSQRARALAAIGRSDEAVADAKRVYDYCLLKYTSEAISLLCDLLPQTYPNNPVIVQQFKLQQLEGSDTTHPASATQPSSMRCAVLDGIKEDPEPYLSALKQHPGYTLDGCTSRGNLYLLAGKPADALREFEDAYDMAPPNTLRIMTEAIARCMKAQDGTIGRTNRWIDDLRQRAETPATQPAGGKQRG